MTPASWCSWPATRSSTARDIVGRVDRVGERGRLVEAFGEPNPRGSLMWQQEALLVEELEVRPGRDARVLGAHGQRGEQQPERLDGGEHQRHRGVRQRAELFAVLAGVGEEAHEQLQDQVVEDVEEIGHGGGDRIGDDDLGRHAIHRSHAGGHRRVGRLERRIGRLDRLQLLEDREEAAVVGVGPVAARALTLLHDVVDRLAGGGHVGDRHELRPAERVGGHLRVTRADEQAVLAELVGEVVEASLDRAVQVADGVELLAPGHDVGRGHDRQRRAGGVEAVGVLQLHALGALEEQEVAQRPFAEGHECELHARRVALRLVRHVRPGDVGGRSDCREEVVDERPVQHLLGSNAEDGGTPTLERRDVLGRQGRIGPRLEAERGVEVLAHQRVFELGRLAEQVRERLAVLDDNGWFRHSCAKLAKLAPADAVSRRVRDRALGAWPRGTPRGRRATCRVPRCAGSGRRRGGARVGCAGSRRGRRRRAPPG